MDRAFPHSLHSLTETLGTDHENLVRYLRKYFRSGGDYIMVSHGSGPHGRRVTFWVTDSCCRHMVTLAEGLPRSKMIRARGSYAQCTRRGILMKN